MATHRKAFVGVMFAVALLLTAGATARAASPQEVLGTYLELETESDGMQQIIKISLGTDRVRMDMAGGVSMVSIGGDAGKMMMIQHEERRYLEFTKEMMEGMMGMMGQMPRQEVEDQVEDATPPTFTRTGNTKQVGEWNAYEVLVEHPDQDDDMTMWFTQDIDADFRVLAESIMESLSSITENPMMRGMTGGGGGQGVFGQIQSRLSDMEMPDGFPVQIVTDDGTNTLRAIDQAASFGPTTWEAPEGYEKMTIPFRR